MTDLSRPGPTPWAFRTYSSDPWGIIRDARNNLACTAGIGAFLDGEARWQHIQAGTDPTAPNATFIITAVNNHVALVAALKAIIAADDEFRSQLPKDWDGDKITDCCKVARKLLETI